MRFCFLTEKGVPAETGDFLAKSCAERGIEFFSIEGRAFDFDPARRLGPGDMLYRGATSSATLYAEQFLYSPGVATFFREPDGIYFNVNTPTLRHERCGVPMPRTVYVGSDQVDLLTSLVERVGGFPAVLKVMGKSSGVGVMIVESMRSLTSVATYAISQGAYPVLCEFIPDAIHWRVIVVGDRVVASYKNQQRIGDFRTDGSRNPVDFTTPIPDCVAQAAILATHTQGTDFAGVDVLEATDGKPYVLEANYPCYYPHAQKIVGVDISGAMVDYLVSRVK
jgi:RimK-like ATP-grasp domain